MSLPSRRFGFFARPAYAKLPSIVTTLTGEGRDQLRGQQRDAEDQEAINEFVTAASPQEEAVREILRRLFPLVGRFVGGTSIGGGQLEYRRKRRVADPDVLRTYLRRTVPEGVTPAQLAEEAYGSMGNRERLSGLLENLDADALENVIARLEDYEGEFDPGAAEVATEVLLNQMPRLREGRRGMMDFGADLVVTRIVLRVLGSVEDEDERLAIIKRVLPRVEQLSGRMELIDLADHRENVGHRLIPEAAGPELYRDQDEQVLTADPTQLAEERQLLVLFLRATEDEEDETSRERVRELCEDDAVFIRLLRSAVGEIRTQGMGEAHVSTTPQLPWELLAQILGGEDRLRERVLAIGERVDRGQLEERTRFALETAERYVSGDLPTTDDRF